MKLITKRFVLTFSLFWAVLLPNTVSADQQHGCLKLKELRSEYNAVAKPTWLPVQLKFKSHDCHLPVESPSFNVSLSTETQSGFELSTHDQSYGKIKKLENSSAGKVTDEIKLKVFVTITGNLAPGNYEVPAVLNYQAIDSKGDLVQQSTPVVIPVKVVASLAEVHVKQEADPMEKLKTTGEVALVIVLMPVWIVLGIVGMVTGHPILSDC
jgi:hypothetical protein